MVNSVIFREDADPARPSSTPWPPSKAVPRPWPTTSPKSGAASRPSPAPACFDAVDDDGEILSESDLMASAYARPVIDHDEVADQDWMELAWLMRYECPDLFTEMLLVLRAKVRAFESGRPEFEDDEDEDRNKVETSETDFGRATPVAQDPDEESAI
jgi:hypothetical protein